ncbi:MAG: BACON domain-containing protein, partial [Alistipes sp.]|nr:BACON domain-containing protein [Alistipes sp.]
MKKFIITYCMVLFALFLANCTTTEEGLDATDVIVVSTDKLEMSSKGGQSSITVDSYCPWQITSTEDWSWIRTTVNNGYKGETTFKLILSENTTVDNRTATVTISNNIYGTSHDISVLQEAGAPYINLSKSSISSSAAGSSVDVTIDSNVDYTISSSESWCKVSANRGDIGKNALRVTIQSSPSTSQRTATIKIANTKRKVTKEITVSQVAFKPSLEVSENIISATNEGMAKSLTVTSNIAWTATCEENWVTLAPVNGASTGTLKATIAANTTTASRTATIKVLNTEYRITKTITVSQGALDPSLEVSLNAISTTNVGTSKQLTVTSNIAWSATCEADWVTLTPANGTKGSKTLKATIAANPTTVSRTATIKVANQEYNITKEISVTQSALIPSLEVSDTAITATSTERTKSVTITSSIAWTATCEANWVTLTPVNGTRGTTTLNATIAANPTTSSRTATIKVQNSEYGITKNIAVSQEALNPSLEVSVNTISATVQGLTKQLTVTSTIPWVATCEAD